MADNPGPDDGRQEPLGDRIGRRVERRLRARKDSRHTAWFGLGMFGLVGWSVAVPALLGIALGLWLDARWPGQPSWTLTFLIIGVAVGCLNAWYWIKQESERD
jgi:ATP synthase protein I